MQQLIDLLGSPDSYEDGQFIWNNRSKEESDKCYRLSKDLLFPIFCIEVNGKYTIVYQGPIWKS